MFSLPLPAGKPPGPPRGVHPNLQIFALQYLDLGLGQNWSAKDKLV